MKICPFFFSTQNFLFQLSTLIDFGFDDNLAKGTLLRTGNDLERSIEMLLNGMGVDIRTMQREEEAQNPEQLNMDEASLSCVVLYRSYFRFFFVHLIFCFFPF